ncbi:MAG: hypothetical protein HOE90_08725 [Bacteriovoracaceae bacterium]|nr:hypothetical protein [Bacteriovoracaceae bacterium]
MKKTMLIITLLSLSSFAWGKVLKITQYSRMSKITSNIYKIESVSMFDGSTIPFYDLYNPDLREFKDCLSKLKRLPQTDRAVVIYASEYKMPAGSYAGRIVYKFNKKCIYRNTSND